MKKIVIPDKINYPSSFVRKPKKLVSSNLGKKSLIHIHEEGGKLIVDKKRALLI